MQLFSRLRAVSFTPNRVSVIPKRGIRFPNYGLPTNPTKIVNDFCAEPHGKHMFGVFKIMAYVLIPIVSVYAWYEEYEEKFVHRRRLPFPKHDFLHAADKPFKFGDGKHTPLHHPYFNFTKYGYETDKDGNPLPPGVYAME